jgi:hypothetical protein
VPDLAVLIVKQLSIGLVLGIAVGRSDGVDAPAVVVRDGQAIPPRGSTRSEGGDRVYVLSRKESRRAVEDLLEAWRR